MECFTGPKALERAKDWIEFNIKQYGLIRCDAVIIENQSQFTLEYVTSGYNTGWPQTAVVKAFQQSKEDPYLHQLPPGGVSAQVWRLHRGGNFGKWVGNLFSLGISSSIAMSHVEGYVSLRVKTPGKNYIVPVGFLLGRNRCNKMGIQIRGQDGVLDGRGNVAGHGVDATGVVTDIVEFCSQIPHACSDESDWHLATEQTSTLKVVGKLNNKFLGTHHFIFKDGDAMKDAETSFHQ